MFDPNPTDDDIRQCNGVVLVDSDRGWQETVGALTPSSGARSSRFLRIPVDSSDVMALVLWRVRINAIRGAAAA